MTAHEKEAVLLRHRDQLVADQLLDAAAVHHNSPILDEICVRLHIIHCRLGVKRHDHDVTLSQQRVSQWLLDGIDQDGLSNHLLTEICTVYCIICVLTDGLRQRSADEPQSYDSYFHYKPPLI